ncbi:ThiF family adenylyltransferase [Aquipuribacter hungaricus]|uniref:ThiF family adenylyltransferase n=1 Tax=Aquipuribacter hungaricus TaxID=545624 RepID=A0ABV7WMT2_9MICO
MGDGDDVVRWRPGLARTVRGTRSLQLGVGPDATVLDGLTAADWHLLALLERGHRRRDLEASLPDGPDRDRGRRLLSMLGSTGAVVAGPDGTVGRPGAPGPLTGADVAVVGGAGLGIALTVALAAAGAGTCALVDDGTVGPADVLPGGAAPPDVGRRSTHVAGEAVHRLAPDVRTACPADPDLVVLVSSQVPDAPAGVPLVQAGTTHLPVVLRPDHVVVGPLVVPGRGACLHCLDLHHSDVDPGWPDAVRLLRRGAGRVRVPAPSTASLVVGLVAELVAGPDRDERAGVEVKVGRGGSTTWRRWAAHPACGCVGWPDPPPDRHPGSRRADHPPAPSRGGGATMAA